jgi:tetratricopeptide (TPR) repeat protein
MNNEKIETGTRRSKDVLYSLALIIALIVIFAVGGFGYWYFLIRHDFSSTYARLGIAPLPVNVELETEISKRLEQLGREPCYKDGMLGFADALVAAGYPREADTGLLSFAKRCGDSDAILLRRHQALLKASDFTNALGIANDLVASDPVKATYRYARAQTYEQLKDFESALHDYIVSVQLLGTPSRVAGFHFYDIARMYAALGRFCDAIAAVETFVAFSPAARPDAAVRQHDTGILQERKLWHRLCTGERANTLEGRRRGPDTHGGCQWRYRYLHCRLGRNIPDGDRGFLPAGKNNIRRGCSISDQNRWRNRPGDPRHRRRRGGERCRSSRRDRRGDPGRA